MSSSSDNEEEIRMPVKKVKRRHHPMANVDVAKFKKVNLYSHKILPKLDALAKSPVKESDEDEGNECVPFDISDHNEKDPVISPPSSPKKVERNKHETSSDTSPTKIIPPTPPPAFIPKKRRRGRAKKLLQEVSSVLSQVTAHDTSEHDISVTSEPNKDVKEMMIKVRLRGRLQKIPLMETDSFNHVFETLGKRSKVDPSRILITFGDRRVFPSDTPEDINLSVADIMECVITHSRLPPDIKETLRIQMQGPNQKKKMLFTMGKSEPFLEVMKEYAKKFRVSLEDLQFQFDGENVAATDSPQSLDIDNDDCIDVLQVKK